VPKQNADMQKQFNYTDSLPPVWGLEWIQEFVSSSKHSPQSQIPETFNAELRTASNTNNLLYSK
jgi:hypothetical protein